MAFDISTAKFDDGQPVAPTAMPSPATKFDLSTATFDEDQTQAMPVQAEQPVEQSFISKAEDALARIPVLGAIPGVANMIGGDREKGFDQFVNANPGVIAAESALSLASGIGSQVVGGLGGAATALSDGGAAGGQVAKDVAAAGTYQPRSQGAKDALGRLEYVGKAIHWLENTMGEGAEEIMRGLGVDPNSVAAGSVSAGARTLPTALSFAVPVGAAAKSAPKAVAGNAAAESQIPRMIETVQKAESSAPASASRKAALEDLAVRSEPQLDIGKAFEESGIPAQSVPAEVLAGSQEFRQLAGAARSVPASPAQVQYRNFLNEVSARVDDMAAKAGAESADMINAEVAGALKKNIDDATTASRQLWDDAEKSIAPNQAVDTSAISNRLLERLDEVAGDAAELSPLERRLAGRFLEKSEKGVFQAKAAPKTWSSLSGLRKELNAARGGKGGFKDAAGYELDAYAGLVSDVQGAAAKNLGAGDKFAAAMESTGVKKRAQETAQSLLGKNLDKSFTVALDSKGGNLAKGRVDEFNKAIEAVPAESRQQAVTSFVFGKIVNSKNLDSRLDVANFNNFYNQLNANPTAKAALYRHMTPETRSAVDNIGKMTGAIKRANEDFIATGRINSLNEGWKLADSFVGRVGRLALATKLPGIGPAVADIAGSALSKGSRRVEQAASDLMGSPEFHGYITKAMDDPASVAAKAAESSLAKSKEWRSFYAQLPATDRTAIRNTGIAGWLQAAKGRDSR